MEDAGVARKSSTLRFLRHRKKGEPDQEGRASKRTTRESETRERDKPLRASTFQALLRRPSGYKRCWVDSHWSFLSICQILPVLSRFVWALMRRGNGAGCVALLLQLNSLLLLMLLALVPLLFCCYCCITVRWYCRALSWCRCRRLKRAQALKCSVFDKWCVAAVFASRTEPESINPFGKWGKQTLRSIWEFDRRVLQPASTRTKKEKGHAP